MVEHKCKRCGYTCDRISNLKQHLSRFSVCEPILTDTSCIVLLQEVTKVPTVHKCVKCNRILASKQSLQRHIATCTDASAQIGAQFASLHTEMAELRLQVHQQVTQQVATNNIQNHTTNNITNNYQINLNSYGSEDHSYISSEFAARCIKGGTTGIVQYIEELHLNESHPENMNVKNLSKKQALLLRYEGAGSWVECDKNFTIDEMIKSSSFRLSNFALNNKQFFYDDELSHEENIRMFDRYMEPYISLRPGNQEFYSIRREIFASILKVDGHTNITLAVA